jgi:LuxR family maltose regulon positive regulatory protein
MARDLARAVVAVRETGRLPRDTPPLPEPDVLHAHLPLAWAAELAVSAVAAGREDGRRLLDAAWPGVRSAVAELEQRAGGALRRAARDALARLAMPPSGRLELRLLGPVELARDGALVDAPDWRRERVRSLLAYLVLHGTASRSEIADALWPRLDAEAQSRNLRVTLTYLLRVLEPDRGQRDASFFVRQHGGNLSLHTGSWLTVDLWEFDAHSERAREADRRGAPAEALDHALQAVELWRGEPTELLSEPSAVSVVEPRRLQFAQLAVRAGELLLARGNVDDAHTLAERALAVDPWLEAAHRLVVAIHRATGDHMAARRALARYRDAIHELGMGPDEATLMVERLLDSVPPGTSLVPT